MLSVPRDLSASSWTLWHQPAFPMCLTPSSTSLLELLRVSSHMYFVTVTEYLDEEFRQCNLFCVTILWLIFKSEMNYSSSKKRWSIMGAFQRKTNGGQKWIFVLQKWSPDQNLKYHLSKELFNRIWFKVAEHDIHLHCWKKFEKKKINLKMAAITIFCHTPTC